MRPAKKQGKLRLVGSETRRISPTKPQRGNSSAPCLVRNIFIVIPAELVPAQAGIQACSREGGKPELRKIFSR